MCDLQTAWNRQRWRFPLYLGPRARMSPWDTVKMTAPGSCCFSFFFSLPRAARSLVSDSLHITPASSNFENCVTYSFSVLKLEFSFDLDFWSVCRFKKMLPCGKVWLLELKRLWLLIDWGTETKGGQGRRKVLNREVGSHLCYQAEESNSSDPDLYPCTTRKTWKAWVSMWVPVQETATCILFGFWWSDSRDSHLPASWVEHYC